MTHFSLSFFLGKIDNTPNIVLLFSICKELWIGLFRCLLRVDAASRSGQTGFRVTLLCLCLSTDLNLVNKAVGTDIFVVCI